MIARPVGDGIAIGDQQDIECEQQEPADHVELLRQHAEDEVGPHLGQVIEMALRPLQQSLAEHPARAERDLRLHDVIARAERVILRIEEGQHAFLLIVMQELESEEARRDRRADDQRKFPQPHPGDEKDDPRPRDQHQRCPEIRLTQDQCRW